MFAKLPARSAVEAAIFIVFGLISVVEARYLYTTKDPALLFAQMQPGFYIAFLGIVLIALGLAHLASDMITKHAAADEAGIGHFERRRVVLIVASLVAYALLISVIGYVFATALFFIAVLAILGVQPLPYGIVLSGIFAAVTYFVFVQFCDVVWPAGKLIDFP